MWAAFANAKATGKSFSHFFNKNIHVYAIFNNQSFNDTLTNDMVSFEQLGSDQYFYFYNNSPEARHTEIFCY